MDPSLFRLACLDPAGEVRHLAAEFRAVAAGKLRARGLGLALRDPLGLQRAAFSLQPAAVLPEIQPVLSFCVLLVFFRLAALRRRDPVVFHVQPADFHRHASHGPGLLPVRFLRAAGEEAAAGRRRGRSVFCRLRLSGLSVRLSDLDRRLLFSPHGARRKESPRGAFPPAALRRGPGRLFRRLSRGRFPALPLFSLDRDAGLR